MANVCIICFKERNNESQNKADLQRKYFEFVERYLSEVGGGSEDLSSYHLTNFLFEQALKSGMVWCGSCHQRMESFCDLYNQLKTIELRLNWELERLKNNLEFEGELESEHGLHIDMDYWCSEDEMLVLVRDLRKSIADKCNRKLNKSFPKVAVSKHGCEKFLIHSTTKSIVKYAETSFSVYSDPGGLETQQNDPNNHEESNSIFDNVAIANLMGKSNSVDLHALPKDIRSGRLRKVNKCDRCSRTFSTPEKLLGHLKGCHYSVQEITDESSADHESLEGSYSTDSDSEYFVDNSYPQANRMDESEDAFKAEEPNQNEQDIKPVIKIETGQSQAKPFILNNINQSKPIILRSKQYRFKCPDCPKLYTYLHELLLHYNKRHKNPDEVKETLLLDIFWISRQMLSWKCRSLSVLNLAAVPPDALHYSATFETPTHIYFCKYSSCKEQPIYSEDALHNHAKLHGEFKCSFCSVTDKFAPDLSLHEITQHNKRKIKGFSCSRCRYKNLLCKEGVINHHLTVHSKLPSFYTQGNCTVCKVSSNTFRTPYFLIEHCIKIHNNYSKEKT